MASSSNEQANGMIHEIAEFLNRLFQDAEVCLNKSEVDFVGTARCYHEAASALLNISPSHDTCTVTISSLQQTPLTVAKVKSELETKVTQLGTNIFAHEMLSVTIKVRALKFIAAAERKLQCSPLTVSKDRLEMLKQALLEENAGELTGEQQQTYSLIEDMLFNTLPEEEQTRIRNIKIEAEKQQKKQQVVTNFRNKVAEVKNSSLTADNALMLIQAYDQTMALEPEFSFSQLTDARYLIPSAFVKYGVSTMKKEDIKRAIDICLQDMKWRKETGPDYRYYNWVGVGPDGVHFADLVAKIGPALIRNCYTEEELRQCAWFPILEEMTLIEEGFAKIQGVPCLTSIAIHPTLGLTNLGAMLLFHKRGGFFQSDGTSSDFSTIRSMQPLFSSAPIHLERGGNTLFHLIAASTTGDYETIAAMALLMSEQLTSLSVSEIDSLVAAWLQQENQYGERPLHVALRRGKIRTAQVLIELGADIHAMVTHPSPLLSTVVEASRIPSVCWLNGENLLTSPVASSSNNLSLTATPELPIMMVLKFISKTDDNKYRQETIQLAIKMLQHGAILPEIATDSPLFSAQQAVFQQIQEERNEFLLKLIKAKFSLEKKLSWWLVENDMEPIRHKVEALDSFLDAYLENCFHPELPILKILQEWASKHSAHYTALQQTTFGFDSATLQMIEDLLSPLSLDCQKKYLHTFKGFTKGASYDRIIDSSTRTLIIDVLNRVSVTYRRKYQETFAPSASQQTHLSTMSRLERGELLKRLLDHFKLTVSDHISLTDALNAFLLGYHSYYKSVAWGFAGEIAFQRKMPALSLAQQSTLADALVIWASVSRSQFWITEAIHTCMQHAFFERQPQLIDLARWCQGEHEVLSLSAMDMMQKDFDIKASEQTIKIVQLRRNLFPNYKKFRELANHFDITQEAIQNADSSEMSHWHLLANYYSETELKQFSWYAVYEYFFLFSGNFNFFKLSSSQPNDVHPVYGITDLGVFLSIGLALRRPVTLEHVTVDNMAQERGANTLLHLAAMNNCFTCGKENPDGYYCNAQHFARPLAGKKVEGSLVTPENIILLEAMLRHRNQYGEMPLHVALRTGHLDLAWCFIELGADIHAPAPELSPLYEPVPIKSRAMKMLSWLREKASYQHQPSTSLASTSSEVANIPETPLMIVLRLINNSGNKLSENWFRRSLRSFAMDLLIYGATYSPGENNTQYDDTYRGVKYCYEDEKKIFSEKIRETIERLEKKKAGNKLITDQLEALTSLKDALDKSDMPVLRVLHDWVKGNPGLYATLMETGFFVGSATAQLIKEQLKKAPAYYREKYKDIFEPSKAATLHGERRHLMLPGLTSSSQEMLDHDNEMKDTSASEFLNAL